MTQRKNTATALILLFGLSAVSSSDTASAGAFVFAGEGNGVDVVAHPSNYTGAGGTVNVEVCIAPGTPNASAMEIPVQNIVNTVNAFEAQQPNLVTGGATNVPFSQWDFESVALHEVGHCIGLAHPNLGSGAGAANEFTNTTDGANDTIDADDGLDNIDGSADDQRGDDENLHWFFIGDNNPFARGNATVDASTYSRDLADLPFGDDFPANASEQTGASFGVPDTEAVMQQGSPNGQAQRDFAIDDIATLEFGRSGLDETAGTADDYDIQLTYGGIKSGCDVNLAFDNSETGFAVCKLNGSFLNANHIRITAANSYFNTDAVPWFFNDISNATEYTLEIMLAGDGDGTVTDDLGQIDCYIGVGEDCEGTYPNRTEISLSASADPDSYFAGWSGDCAGIDASLALTIEADSLCTATFTRLGEVDFSRGLVGVDEPDEAEAITVSLSKDPTEDVVIGLASNRPTECVPVPTQLVIPAGSDTAVFDIQAVADDQVDGQQACTIVPANTVSDDPAFDDIALEQIDVVVNDINVALSITLAGAGNGRVFDDLGEIDCASDCQGVYEAGDAVSLLVEADTGSAFAGWSGGSACSGNGRLDLTLNDDLNCTATFVAQRSLSVNPTTLNVSEPDGRDTVMVTLDDTPSAEVSISLASSDSNECVTSVSTLVIPANTTQASFDVLAVDDAVEEPTQSCTIITGATGSADSLFDGIEVPEISVNVLDNDDPDVIFSDRFVQ